MEQEQPDSEQTEIEFSFEDVYANNARFEASAWDLKILFGQLEQHTGTPTIDWRTAVTIPWSQAKILSYYLRLNLAFHEFQNGPISIPGRVVPPVYPAPTEKQLKDDPRAMEVYETNKRIHTEMFG